MFGIAPLSVPSLNQAKLAAVKFEQNKGNYIELWVVVGYFASVFVQVYGIFTGKEATLFKVEDGIHPLSQKILSKCDTCNKWFQLPPGDCPECSGTLVAYDGHTRLLADVTPSTVGDMYDDIEDWIQAEEVPAPGTLPTTEVVTLDELIEWAG